MTVSTPGFVLHSMPYSESSAIVRVFTRLLGLRSYIIKGVRRRGSRTKQNMLQPLCCLDMVVYDSKKTDLNYVRELSLRHPQPEGDAVCNALRFFEAEVLFKTLREGEPLPELWDKIESHWASFSARRSPTEEKDRPQMFILEVCRHLGVAPMNNRSSSALFFDLEQGCFTAFRGEAALDSSLSALLHSYMSASEEGHLPPPTTPEQRSSLLQALTAYCKMHLSGTRNIESQEILHTILR